MQSRRAALAAAAALVVVAVVLFIALKGGSSSPPVTKGVTLIEFRNREPVGGVKDITENKGDRVRFKVHSEMTADIHVHGYEFEKPVKPGGTVSFNFPATLDGAFDIEAHPNGNEEAGIQLASLTVNP
jgi:hypothetical protein